MLDEFCGGRTGRSFESCKEIFYYLVRDYPAGFCLYCRYNIFPELFAERLFDKTGSCIGRFQEPYRNLKKRLFHNYYVATCGPFGIHYIAEDIGFDERFNFSNLDPENTKSFLQYYFENLSFTFQGFNHSLNKIQTDVLKGIDEKISWFKQEIEKEKNEYYRKNLQEKMMLSGNFKRKIPNVIAESRDEFFSTLMFYLSICLERRNKDSGGHIDLDSASFYDFGFGYFSLGDYQKAIENIEKYLTEYNGPRN